MRRRFNKVLWVIVGLYVAYAALMVWVHPQFIYPFSQTQFSGQGYEAVAVAVEDADPVTVFVHQGRRDRAAVVYFMGNLGAVELFRPMLDHHKSKGRSVIAMTFRGGGGEAGTPSEVILKRDALAVMSVVPDLVQSQGIVVQGFSLGTGLAVHVAARHDVDGVILSAPYDKMCRLMTKASGLPACYLPVQGWKTLHDIDGVSAPVLIIHGTADRVIPYVSGANLAGKMQDQGIRVTFRDIQGGGHNNLTRFPDYLPAIDDFVTGLL